MYSNNEYPESAVYTEIIGPSTFSYLVDVLGGVTYQFYVRAVTIKPGENASLHVVIPEYGRFDNNSVITVLHCFIWVHNFLLLFRLHFLIDKR